MAAAIVTAEEVRAHLGLPAGADVATIIAAVTGIIEARIGPVIDGTVTETFNGAVGGAALLASRPLAVTAVTADGVPIDAADYRVDPLAGIIYLPAGRRDVAVTYTTGLDPLPGTVKLAALELARHLHAPQLGQRPAIGLAPEGTTVVSGYAVPNRVIELLDATPGLPGFA